MADEEGSLDGAAIGVDEVLPEYLLVDPVDDAFHFNHWGEVRSRKINKLQAPVLDYLIYSRYRYPLLEQLINS